MAILRCIKPLTRRLWGSGHMIISWSRQKHFRILKKCYVFTTTEQGSTVHMEFVNENVVALLKEQQGSNVWMIGGASKLDTFMKENIIDEYMITPTISSTRYSII